LDARQRASVGSTDASKESISRSLFFSTLVTLDT